MKWTQTNQKICALIPGAGSGNRMRHSVKKPYLKLGDKPILAHTIGAFDRNSVIDSIFVMVDAADFETCQSTVITPYAFQKVRDLVAGGETRQASVFNGLQALPTDVDFVIVHDGVRPFVTDQMIFACLEAADEWGAAVAAIPVKDTIKVASADGFIVDTPERDKLWAVQTPQAFRASLLLEAHEHAQRKQMRVTDDAALVEQLGFKVKLVMGSYSNLKITTPEDLIIAEALKKVKDEDKMPITYTNRKGRTYYLCQGTTKGGKPRYYFAREPKDTLPDVIPDGYEIQESVNAIVSLAKAYPTLLLDEEIETVKTTLQVHPKHKHYRIDTKSKQIAIYEHVGPDRSEWVTTLLAELGTERSLESGVIQRLEEEERIYAQFTPIMRFILTDPKKRHFKAQRMCILSSIDDWIDIAYDKTIAKLAPRLIPTLGTDAFFQLF